MTHDEKELAYFAGLFDGEGSVVINKMGLKEYALYIRITNTDMNLLAWTKDRFGGYISKQGDVGPNSGTFRHRPCWYWATSGERAKEILEQILPYLIGSKKDQAKIAIEFQVARERVKSEGRVLRSEQALWQSYKERVSSLKGRGPVMANPSSA